MAHRGAVAKVAYAHHNNNRNVLDEWVFRLQGANPIHQLRQTGEGVTPSPVCSVIGQKYSLKAEKILEFISQLFYGYIYAEFYSHFGASFFFCNLLVSVSTKIVQQYSAALDIWKLGNGGM